MTATQTSDVYYDPYDVEIDRDPYPTFRRLREEAPLYYNERHDFYAVSRYDDVERGLVALTFRFDHPGPTEANGFTSRYTEPNGMVIMEIWKVDGGEIVHIESILDVFEYGRPLGWEA